MSPPVFHEANLRFEFSKPAERLDVRGVPIPVGIRLTDFVVDEGQYLLLVEVKDPSDPGIPLRGRDRSQRRFRDKLIGDALISEELVPKARAS